MPTTRPPASASAPPELPGLRAASVWMTFSIIRVALRSRVTSDRPTALTTPAVTDPAKPSGLPTATTSWPTRRRSASPSSAAARRPPSTRRTARSEERIGAGDLERRLRPVGERSDAIRRASHDVRGGQKVTVRCEDDAGTGAVRLTVARAATDTQLDDARQQMLRDRGDDRRVRVERLDVVELAVWPIGPRRRSVGEPDDVAVPSHDVTSILQVTISRARPEGGHPFGNRIAPPPSFAVAASVGARASPSGGCVPPGSWRGRRRRPPTTPGGPSLGIPGASDRSRGSGHRRS